MSRALRLGIFIVATLLAFAIGVFWIGSDQFRFTSTYRLNADFENVAGLSVGAAVRVGGIHEGDVHGIILPTRPDQKVRVEMDLKGATRNVIKKDSIAAIKTEGLVGDEYVEVTFGSTDSPSVKNGDSIGSEPPLQISDMVKKMDGLLDSARAAVGNLDAITAKLNNGQGSAGALINSKAVYQHVNEAAANLQEDTEALKHNFLLRGFFKNRGYEDTDELKRYAIAELPAAPPQKRFDYRAAKLFDKPDSAKLKDTKMLDDAGKFLEQNPYSLAVVVSEADRKGDTDKQIQLTQARAAVVREFLAQRFKLDDTRLKTKGMGKSPDASDGGAVSILIYSGK